MRARQADWDPRAYWGGNHLGPKYAGKLRVNPEGSARRPRARGRRPGARRLTYSVQSGDGAVDFTVTASNLEEAWRAVREIYPRAVILSPPKRGKKRT